MMETTISNFHTIFIPSIQKFAFHIPHVQILGTNHCGEYRRTAFKRRESFQDVLCRSDYAERVVASFSNQIQSEHYGGNISVSIEGITFEHFIALPQTEMNSSKNHVRNMKCFILFCKMIANNMLPLLLHTAIIWLNCFKNEKNWCQH